MDSRAAQRQTKALKALQGRADLRAATQPDPPAGRGSPKKKLNRDLGLNMWMRIVIF